MRSLGLDLRPWVDAGLLRIWAARPSAFGLETHLAVLAQLIEERRRRWRCSTGSPASPTGDLATEVTSMVARKLDLLKSRGITTLATALGHGDETSTVEHVVDGGHLAAAAQRRDQR